MVAIQLLCFSLVFGKVRRPGKGTLNPKKHLPLISADQRRWKNKSFLNDFSLSASIGVISGCAFVFFVS